MVVVVRRIMSARRSPAAPNFKPTYLLGAPGRIAASVSGGRQSRTYVENGRFQSADDFRLPNFDCRLSWGWGGRGELRIQNSGIRILIVVARHYALGARRR